MSTTITAAQRFVNFCTNGLPPDHEERAEYIGHLQSQWHSKNRRQQAYVVEGMNQYDACYQRFDGLVEAALSFRASILGQRNRKKMLAVMGSYRDIWLSLSKIYRENAIILAQFQRFRMDELDFGPYISAWFTHRVLSMNQLADRVYKDVVELEAAIRQIEGRFDKDEPVIDGNWYPVKCLSDRSANTAHLWVDYDPVTMMIRNRIVRKDTAFRQESMTDGTRWKVDWDNPANGQPLEWYLQHKLNDIPDSRSIVEAVKCNVDVGKLVYRLYLQYYQYGDLAELIKRYIDDKALIPEPFLWWVFETLVEAGFLMSRGGAKYGRKDWEEIVHRDLKPDNVFLDEPAESYPKYPTPRLGDFGLAIRTSEDDPLNPTSYNGGAGTSGFKAPEQLRDGHRIKSQLLAHTNVFGIGCIMWSLANRKLSYDRRLDDLKTTRQVGGTNTATLSKELLELIQNCLEYEPVMRKSFGELRQEIKSRIDAKANDGGMFQFIAAARRGVQPDETYELSPFSFNPYRLGLALLA